MKRIVVAMLVLITALCSVFASGQAEDDGVVTLEFAIKETGSTLEAYEAIVDSFNSSRDDVQVEIVSYGKDYQSLMKTKMAANDLPDLFTTHGWAVALYGDYLEPLNDRSWTEHLIPEIKSTVTDYDGNIVALPCCIWN